MVAALNTQLEDLREEIVSTWPRMAGLHLTYQTATAELFEAQGVQLREAIERQSSSDAYVLELRGRLHKLSERDAASEVRASSLDVCERINRD